MYNKIALLRSRPVKTAVSIALTSLPIRNHSIHNH